MERWDAVVVGAGPAGCVCAAELARLGVKVLVLERGEAGREKVCGEGLLPRGVGVLGRMGLAGITDGGPRIGGIAIHVAGRVVEVRFGGAVGVGVRRERLDRELAEAAARAGAVVRFGERVRRIERTGAGMRVETRRGSSVARVVVGADGARSIARRLLGLEGVEPARRMGVVVHASAEWRGTVDLWLERGWQVAVTPVPGGASVAALVGGERVKELGRGPEAWVGARLAEAGIAVGRIGEARCVAIGGAAKGVITDGGVLIGDAAGVIDPIVGCGISVALETGEAAARAIVGGRLAEYAEEQRRIRRRAAWAAGAGLWMARNRRWAGVAATVMGRWPGLGDRLADGVAG